MKSLILFIFQVALIAGLLYTVFNVPQLDSDSKAFEDTFRHKAIKFDLHSKNANPQQPGPQPNEPKPKPKPEPEPEPNNPDPEPNNPEPKPNNPDEEPQPNPNQPEKEPPLSVIGKEIDEFLLKKFPAIKHDSKVFCQRKDRRREQICKVTGINCIRYSPTQELAHFWFVAALYTPDQYKTRKLYELHHYFVGYAKLFGIQTQAIEVVFPGQDFIATKPNNAPYDLQYRADWIFNMRENLVNVGAKHLPADWEYIAWVDAHIFWDENRYWFEDVIVELGRNNIVHMLGSNDFFDERNKTNFYEEGVGKIWDQTHRSSMNPIRQCGMAWATRRDIFEGIGGLLDVCVGTKCDLYQNYAYFGETFTQECTNPEYAAAVRNWQINAGKHFQKKVGYVRGNIIHFQHCNPREGCRTSNYDMMTQSMSRMNFNPNTDMKRDAEGRMQWSGNWELAKTLWNIYGGSPRLRRV